jgi:hypothetical protein
MPTSRTPTTTPTTATPTTATSSPTISLSTKLLAAAPAASAPDGQLLDMLRGALRVLWPFDEAQASDLLRDTIRIVERSEPTQVVAFINELAGLLAGTSKGPGTGNPNETGNSSIDNIDNTYIEVATEVMTIGACYPHQLDGNYRSPAGSVDVTVDVTNDTLAFNFEWSGSKASLPRSIVPVGFVVVAAAIEPSVFAGGENKAADAISYISVTILDQDGNEQPVEKLDTPVEIEFIVAKLNVSEEEVCAWINAEGNWSSRGVTTEVLGPSPEGSGTVVLCRSTHLTLFGIVSSSSLAEERVQEGSGERRPC